MININNEIGKIKKRLVPSLYDKCLFIINKCNAPTANIVCKDKTGLEIYQEDSINYKSMIEQLENVFLIDIDDDSYLSCLYEMINNSIGFALTPRLELTIEDLGFGSHREVRNFGCAFVYYPKWMLVKTSRKMIGSFLKEKFDKSDSFYLKDLVGWVTVYTIITFLDCEVALDKHNLYHNEQGQFIDRSFAFLNDWKDKVEAYIRDNDEINSSNVEEYKLLKHEFEKISKNNEIESKYVQTYIKLCDIKISCSIY